MEVDLKKAVEEVKAAEANVAALLKEQSRKTDDLVKDTKESLGTRIEEATKNWQAALAELKAAQESATSKTNEVDTEAKRRIDEIEKRLGHPGGDSGVKGGGERKAYKSIGAQFVEKLLSGDWASAVGTEGDRFQNLKQLMRSPALEVSREDFVKTAQVQRAKLMEAKANIVSSDATRFVAPFRDADLPFPQRRLSLRDYMEVVPVKSNSVEYIRLNGVGPETALAVTSIVAGDGSTATAIATVTTPVAHGLSRGNFVQIVDSTDTDYNGTFRVDSVPTTTTFTYTMLAIPGDATADGTILYRPLSFGGAAAERAEAAAKAEAKFLFEQVTAYIRSIAHFVPASKEILDDLPSLRSLIDTHLIYGVQLKEERQGFYGTGSGDQVQGILTLPGIQTLTQGSLSSVDVIRRARTYVQLTDLMADLVVMHPLDWESVETKKGSDDHYVLAGGAAGSENRVWRLPVLETTSILQGDVLVGAFGMGATMYEREAANISFSDSHSDFFTKNLLAIRAESRIGYAWKYPSAFCLIDFSG